MHVLSGSVVTIMITITTVIKEIDYDYTIAMVITCFLINTFLGNDKMIQRHAVYTV